MSAEPAVLNKPWLKGKWNEMKGKIREEWGKLTDDDLDRIAGRRDQMIGLIQQRYGVERAKAEEQISSWEERHGLR